MCHFQFLSIFSFLLSFEDDNLQIITDREVQSVLEISGTDDILITFTITFFPKLIHHDKSMDKQDSHIAQGTSQYPVINHNGKEYERNTYIDRYRYVNHFVV